MRPETKAQLDQLSQLLISVGEMVRNDTEAVLKTRNHVDVIKHYAAVRDATVQIKFAREVIADIEDSLSKVYIPEIINEMRETTGEKPPFNIEGVGRVSVANRFSASIIDKENGYKWLRDTDNDSLITETVNSSSLAAFAKSYSEDEGRDLPSEYFKVGIMQYTSITKAK